MTFFPIMVSLIICVGLALAVYHNVRCLHKWDIKVKVVAKPTQSKYDSIKVSENAIDKWIKYSQLIAQGSTSVIFVCDKCGKIKEKEYIGQPISVLDETL